MKIGVFFNCQHRGIATSLRALLPSYNIVSHDVISYGYPDLDRPDSSMFASAAADIPTFDLVVSADFRHDLGPLSPNGLKQRARRLILVPPIIFGGFHPDTCYSTNASFRGPTNAIHSRIAIAGYLAGLSVEDTAALYNKLVFARLGYFGQFAPQRAIMQERFAAYGVDLAPWFDAWLAQGCFMYSVNHPKVHVLFDLARIVCAMAGLDTQPASTPEDDLAYMPSHPVYPDLAAAFGVPAETHFHQVRLPGKPLVELTLEEYLAKSFATFAAAPAKLLRAIDGVADALAALDLGARKAA